MALNRPAIARFIAHFESQSTDIEAVESLMLRKLLYATALDPLARAAFGNIGHRKRITRLLDELTNWNGKSLISLPQLSLNLLAAKKGRSRLAREVRKRLDQWPSGHVLPITASPEQSELLPFTAPSEVKLLDECRYSNLFYTYRNNLVHEFREPGYGMELSTDDEQVYYTSTITGPWELVFPAAFFSSIFKDTLAGLDSYLVQHRIDPYKQFEFGSLWRAK